ANRSIASAVTAVPGTVFTEARPVRQAVLTAPAVQQQLVRAPIVAGGAPIAPAPQSLLVRPVNTQPPEAVLQRPVDAVTHPPARRRRLTSRSPASRRLQDRRSRRAGHKDRSRANR